MLEFKQLFIAVYSWQWNFKEMIFENVTHLFENYFSLESSNELYCIVYILAETPHPVIML